MSVSIQLTGIRPPTDDYKKKFAAYRACQEAGIASPKELSDYFEGVGWQYVNPDGMDVSLYDHKSVTKRQECIFEIDLAKLPAGVTRIRVEMG